MKEPDRRPEISTNVRFQILLTRLGLSLLGRLAPAAADRRALALFATPRRSSAPRPPQVPGLQAHRFRIATDAGELTAWDWGEGARTVLLVHGWNGHAGQMTGFVAPLVRAGFHVVAFDQPAHGQSAGKRATVLLFEQAVLAVARRLGPIHAVIAHSLGATGVGLALAQGLPVERAVLLAPPSEARFYARAFARALGLSAAREDGLLAEMRRLLDGDFGRVDLGQQAARVQTPVLIVHDPDDPAVPFAHGRTIAEALPHARLRPAPGLGHHRILRDPDVIDAAVAFVAGARVAEPLPAHERESPARNRRVAVTSSAPL